MLKFKKKKSGAPSGDGNATAPKRRYRTFSVTSRVFLYLVIWIAALVFTQALRSPASNIFMGFVTVFPLASLIYTLIARSALKIFMLSESAVIEKGKPMTYEFRLINETILPYPFIDAYIRLPENSSVRCSERCVRLSMAPSSTYTVKNEVSFRFRGTYEIGVSCFYVYDFFRMFRVRVDVDYYDTVYVLPRRLIIDADDETAVSDSTSRTRRSPNSYDKLEVSDVREYRMGDTLKSIHWNLSSKTEDLIVRDYNTGTTDLTYVFCDMSRHFPTEPPVRPFVNPYATADEKNEHADADKASDENDVINFGDRDTVSDAGIDTNASHATADPAVRELDDGQIEAKINAAARAAESSTARAGQAGKGKAPKPKRVKKKRADKKAKNLPAEIDVAELVNDRAYDDMNEYCADGVVELTIATVLRELRAGREVNLAWFDERSEIGAFSFDLHSVADLDMIFRLYATSPLAPANKKISRLAATVSDAEDAKRFFIIPTVDSDTVADLCSIPCPTGSGGSGSDASGTDVIVYSANERYAHPAERTAYIDSCRARLSDNGMNLVDGKLDGVRVIATVSPVDGDGDGENSGNTDGVGLGFAMGKVARNG